MEENMLSHLKRRIGVLTAVAVLAALVPTLSIAPASAAANVLTAVTIDDAATYSACPSGAAPAAGFTDTTSTDVDCIAMYGITTGATATTYEPSGSIPRWQMALFLTRFMNEAGYTLGSGADQGFTDISGESAAIQTAINQLKQASVTNGTTATTYSPADNVTREQMAMFIERALSLITPGPGGNSEGASAGVDGAIGNLANYNYSDIDAGVTFEGHNAIVELYHLGVTGDTAAVGLTYRPSADITRAEMATFLTNAAAHTNLRPAGVWIQSSLLTGFGAIGNALSISNRDSSFDAIQGSLIDVFSDVTSAETDPFAASGACNTANTVDIGGASECVIALGDASTDTSGNVAIANGAVADVANGTTVTYWAWTGALAAAYDNDTPANSAVVSSSTAATSLAITNDIPTNNINDTTVGYTENELVKYGTTVTVSGQLKTALLAPVADATAKIVITEETSTLVDGGTASNGVASAQVAAFTTSTVYTDANGAFTYSVTQADPSSSVATNRTQTKLTFTLTHATASISSGALNLSWDDNPGVVEGTTAHTLALNSYYGAGSAAGVSRTATATVYDQYGVGKSGEAVSFGSSDASFVGAIGRTTSSAGVATLGWTDTKTTNVSDTITATHGVAGNPTKTYYRTVTQAASVAEVDTGSATEVGGEGKYMTGAADGVWSTEGAAAHGLVVGDEVIVSSAATVDRGFTVGMKFFVTTVPTASTLTAGATRGGATVLPTGGAIEAGGGTDLEVAPLGIADFANDVLMELVVDDAANNTLVINHLAGADATSTFVTFAYDSNDQFQTSAGSATGPVAATMAAFETAATAKFTLGAPDTAEKGDIYSLNYQALTTGIQIIQLGE